LEPQVTDVLLADFHAVRFHYTQTYCSIEISVAKAVRWRTS
jgi:hypothetical protein